MKLKNILYGVMMGTAALATNKVDTIAYLHSTHLQPSGRKSRLSTARIL